jgi:hypothetical protein
VGDLVDREDFRLTRVVANAEGSKDQDRPPLPLLDAEDHAEPAIRGWEPELDAVPKFGPIRSLRIADKKISNGDSFSLELAARRYRHFSPGTARSPQILIKGSVIEERGRSTLALVAH